MDCWSSVRVMWEVFESLEARKRGKVSSQDVRGIDNFHKD